MKVSYYRRQIKKIEAKIIAHAELNNEAEVKRLNKEVSNYEKFIAQNEPKALTGVDKYLS